MGSGASHHPGVKETLRAGKEELETDLKHAFAEADDLFKKGTRTFEMVVKEGVKDTEKLGNIVSTGVLDALEVLANSLADVGLKDAAAIDSDLTILGAQQKNSFTVVNLISKLPTVKQNEFQAMVNAAASSFSKTSGDVFKQAKSSSEDVAREFGASASEITEVGKVLKEVYTYVRHMLEENIVTSIMNSIIKSLLSVANIASNITVQEQITLTIMGQKMLEMTISTVIDCQQWCDSVAAMALKTGLGTDATQATTSKKDAIAEPSTDAKAEPSTDATQAETSKDDTEAKPSTDDATVAVSATADVTTSA